MEHKKNLEIIINFKTQILLVTNKKIIIHYKVDYNNN